MSYQVWVDDKFHHMDEDGRHALGEFASVEVAVRACRQIVDDFLLSNYKPGMSTEALYGAYTMFGEDPWISGAAEESRPFSSWTTPGNVPVRYAREVPLRIPDFPRERCIKCGCIRDRILGRKKCGLRSPWEGGTWWREDVLPAVGSAKLSPRTRPREGVSGLCAFRASGTLPEAPAPRFHHSCLPTPHTPFRALSKPRPFSTSRSRSLALWGCGSSATKPGSSSFVLPSPSTTIIWAPPSAGAYLPWHPGRLRPALARAPGSRSPRGHCREHTQVPSACARRHSCALPQAGSSPASPSFHEELARKRKAGITAQ